MPDAEYCRRKAETLLSEATSASNMRLRGRLLDEAMRWHNLALEAAATALRGWTAISKRTAPRPIAEPPGQERLFIQPLRENTEWRRQPPRRI